MNRTVLVRGFAMLMIGALVACVTVNVYFPEAAVKSLSQQIEQEIQEKAKQKPEEESVTPPQGSQPQDPGAVEGTPGGGASLLDLGIGVRSAYAQPGEVPAPEITNPAIRKIIDSRASRLAAIRKFKDMGAIGENKQGLLEIRALEVLKDLKERAGLNGLVRAENADREELFRAIAAAKNVDLSQIPRIRETYAETLRQSAKPGDWIQMPDGAWKRKP